MNRKLVKQMRNEWKSNLWLFIELLIVSVVMWYICDYVYVRIANYYDDRGFDIEHCYLIDIGFLGSQSPDFQDKDQEEYGADKWEFLDRLSRRPEVEAASYSGNAHPYNGSNSGTWLQIDTMTTKDYIIRRQVTPDYPRVFRHRGVDGETPEQLAEMLRNGDILPTDGLFAHYGKRTREFVGQGAFQDGDTTDSKRIGASLHRIRYNDWEDWGMNESLISPIRSVYVLNLNECEVRVKENMDKNFAENLLADAEKDFRVGNFYIKGVRSMAGVRDNFLRSATNRIRNYLTGMGFLLLNVFLGLLGTFWFRTQQRVKEIAIRKVSGATSSAVFRRFIGEGVLVLTLATIPALCFDMLLSHNEFNAWHNGVYFEWQRLLVCFGASYLLILIMMIVGIAIPARRAMSVEPTEALHDE